MSVSLTYPGVYLREAPGVHSITGVSTSVAAFVGTAQRGPLNKAIFISSFADFERSFGNLDSASELSYAVRLFFLNGGTTAYVIRVAAGAVTAKTTLDGGAGTAKLKFTAVEGGSTGNAVTLQVFKNAADPVNRFDLVVAYAPPGDPASAVTEQYTGLSMNSRDAKFAVSAINGVSKLVTVAVAYAGTYTAGSSTSLPIASDAAAAAAVDLLHNQLAVSVDGNAPIPVHLASVATIDDIKTQLQTALGAAATVTKSAGPAPSTITITSATPGTVTDFSSVRVLAGAANDVSRRLGFGLANGGAQVDAASVAVPLETPAHGSLKGIGIAQATFAPTSGSHAVRIGVDGIGPDTIPITIPNPNNAPDKLQDVINQIVAGVRAMRPTNPAYKNFSGSYSPATGTVNVTFASGSGGSGSSVTVAPAGSDTTAADLGFTSAATATFPPNTTLGGGNETPITSGNLYQTYINTSAPKQGLYALDDVELFNILVLPGISDPSTIIDAAAYCEQRDAFYIVDPPTAQDPAAMLALAQGTTLPKSDHAAIYWPYIRVGDPNTGGLRSTAPAGALAGVYARTDGQRGIWKAPAGTDASVVGAQALEYSANDAENGLLNPFAVNCVRAKSPYGIIAWGARTMKGSNAAADQYKYIPVRRLASYIKLSLYRGTQWVVFEPNDEPLWSQIRLSIGAFMNTLFRQGAFEGRTARDAYFVKCDSETTTQNDVDTGVVNIVVGFAPLKPAEFVIITLQQIAGKIAT